MTSEICRTGEIGSRTEGTSDFRLPAGPGWPYLQRLTRAGGFEIRHSGTRPSDHREKNAMKSQQSGFTLVEIAIVLVIIGLLLGGILKGQELINSAKVKTLANDFRVIPTYIYAYQDRYKALPGDHATAATQVAGATNATTPAASQGNGVINGNWNSSTQSDES